MSLRLLPRLTVVGVFVAASLLTRTTLGFSPAILSPSRVSSFHTSSLLQLRARGGMPNGVKKENLPSKICVVCNRPFTWRKKWERCWDEVTTCSKSCNGVRRGAVRRAGKLENRAVDQSERSRSASENDSDDDDVDNSGNTDNNNNKESTLTERKAHKKAVKAENRAKREGTAASTTGQKKCDLCGDSVDLLIRCQIDKTGEWKMVCNQKEQGCWHHVSGGVTDGDAAHPYYRYGGLWKNRKAQILSGD